MRRYNRKNANGDANVASYLNQALRNYFNQQPAYVLREDGSQGEAMAKKLAKGIEVKPGEIVIPFTD